MRLVKDFFNTILSDVSTPQKWIHNAKEIVEGTVMYQAKVCLFVSFFVVYCILHVHLHVYLNVYFIGQAISAIFSAKDRRPSAKQRNACK